MNLLKCNVCNIVIDELLAHVQNKVSIIDEETLKRICVSTFTSSEIKNSKTLLFQSLPVVQRKILRKGNRKEERDLDDIISVFKTIDPDVIPVFVARLLEKLPPILFDHLDCTKLLKDLTKLNSEIKEIKTSYVTIQQLEQLRSEVRNLKYASLPPTNNPSTGYVNMKRGAWNMSSGPIGLTVDHNISIEEGDDTQARQQNSKTGDASFIPTDNCVMECTPRSRAVRKDESSNIFAGKQMRSTSIPSVTASPSVSQQIVAVELGTRDFSRRSAGTPSEVKHVE